MSALDIANQVLLMQLFHKLAKEGKSIIFSTHNPNHALALGCDCILLSGGSVISAGKAEAVLSEENLKLLFGSSIRRIENGKEVYCTFRIASGNLR